MTNDDARGRHSIRWRSGDLGFTLGLAAMGGVYVVLVVAMVAANLLFASPSEVLRALGSLEIQYSIKLSLVCCTLAAVFSVWVAAPLGYLLARRSFRGKALVDAILDIPIVLPPLVIGLSLLILFQTPAVRWVEHVIPVTYAVPGVVLAQFAVSAAFAARTMRVAFEQVPERGELVAQTLGCTRAGAFWRVALPEARRGVLTAFTLAWARSLGEFGPILVFCGATRFRTEVLSTTVFLELSIGNLEAAVAVSLLMILAAMVVLMLVRFLGEERYVQ